MKIYNTLTKKIDDFIPTVEGKVRYYTCGPTVYHYAHIGNIRNYIGHDILDKTLRYLGYDVTRAMNITDVGHLTSDGDSGEDKMEVARNREHKSSMEIAEFYTNEFFKDFEKVNCRKPEIVSAATSNIDEYIKIISDLLEKEYAYISGGNIYFDTSKLDNYYCLTNQDSNLVVGARESVDEDTNKKSQTDFVLWFTTSKFENHELLWDSPWGMGYPGWHIECTGISIKYLGDYLDIHGGGVDNIFPHHTNEIAQSEAYLGHKWCNYWFHNEHLIDDSGKMSKSNGGILTVSVLEEQGFNPLSFRFMCLNSHYRKQLLFSKDNLLQSENTYNKLLKKIGNISRDGSIDHKQINKYNDEFKKCLEDDLNTANALSVVYELLKDNSVNGNTKIELLKKFDAVLSLDLCNYSSKNVALDSEIMKLIEKRSLAKKNRNYEEADDIRNLLLQKGIKLIDTRDGTSYEFIKD